MQLFLVVQQCLRPYNAIAVLLRRLTCKIRQILHQAFIIVVFPHTGASRFGYGLVNKIIILVFYSTSVVPLVGNRNIVIHFLVVHAYLLQDVVTKLSVVFYNCWSQKWVIVRPIVFLIKTGREL